MTLELAVARWLLYLSSFVLIGSAGARFVIAGAIDPAIASVRSAWIGRLRHIRLGGAIVLVCAAGAMLVAQVHAWFGPGLLVHRDELGVMLAETHWGRGWTATAITAAAIVAGAGLAMVLPRLDWAVGAAAAIGAATAVPFTGHGSAHGSALWWAHAAHVFGGGLWIGTLAVIVPVTWGIWRPDSSTPGALRVLLSRFSPIALAGASLAVLSGSVLTAEHVVTVSAAFSTDYGRALVMKLAAVFVLAALGWMNWRTSRGSIADPRTRRALRARAIVEAGIALVVVLSVTAVLAGLSPTE